jgi:hypothetical protein
VAAGVIAARAGMDATIPAATIVVATKTAAPIRAATVLPTLAPSSIAAPERAVPVSIAPAAPAHVLIAAPEEASIADTAAIPARRVARN